VASMGGSGRAFARCPHLKIEMWGTQFRGGMLRCVPPAKDGIESPDFSSANDHSFEVNSFWELQFAL